MDRKLNHHEPTVFDGRRHPTIYTSILEKGTPPRFQTKLEVCLSIICPIVSRANPSFWKNHASMAGMGTGATRTQLSPKKMSSINIEFQASLHPLTTAKNCCRDGILPVSPRPVGRDSVVQNPAVPISKSKPWISLGRG